MGVANAQRTLNHIRALTEFIMRPEVMPVSFLSLTNGRERVLIVSGTEQVIPMFGVLNEPQVWVLGDDALRSLCALFRLELRHLLTHLESFQLLPRL